ncbi:MAG: hypothetical protein IT488_00335 [Gammaproteobacteria bacterium]|nr:hypothetical protein [Gammaproteobacteria bacterium]
MIDSAINTETLTIPLLFAAWCVYYYRSVIASKEEYLRAVCGARFEDCLARVPPPEHVAVAGSGRPAHPRHSLTGYGSIGPVVIAHEGSTLIVVFNALRLWGTASRADVVLN